MEKILFKHERMMNNHTGSNGKLCTKIKKENVRYIVF